MLHCLGALSILKTRCLHKQPSQFEGNLTLLIRDQQKSPNKGMSRKRSIKVHPLNILDDNLEVTLPISERKQRTKSLPPLSDLISSKHFDANQKVGFAFKQIHASIIAASISVYQWQHYPDTKWSFKLSTRIGMSLWLMQFVLVIFTKHNT
ncbi:hypothetical protein BD560DRAFT_488645 [Blakeslea trispora]|nr:hypothetical protein BD560DRAFT_488645 [Blakeslea trispora]